MYECISALISSRGVFLGIKIFFIPQTMMYTVIVKCIIQFLLCFEVKLHQLSRPAIKMQMEHKRRQRKFLPLKIHASDWPLHTKVGGSYELSKSSWLGTNRRSKLFFWERTPLKPLSWVEPSGSFTLQVTLWTRCVLSYVQKNQRNLQPHS